MLLSLLKSNNNSNLNALRCIRGNTKKGDFLNSKFFNFKEVNIKLESRRLYVTISNATFQARSSKKLDDNNSIINENNTKVTKKGRKKEEVLLTTTKSMKNSKDREKKANSTIKSTGLYNLFNLYGVVGNFNQKEILKSSAAKSNASVIEGVVVGFKDFVVTITGLGEVQLNEMIRFEGGATGLVLSLEENLVKGIVFTGAANVYTGTKVYRTHSVMLVGVGEGVLGRVVNALGDVLDGKPSVAFNSYMRVERKAPGVITRKKVSEPLITGLKVVDALVPIGKGQRELILGDRKTGKTTIAIDTILNQRLLLETGESPLLCFYVAIGKRLSEIMRIARLFEDRGAFAYTSIVAAPASDPASLQFLAPYSACTMAEYFTYLGQHSLIIYDDLSKHADAYRQLALLLRRPVGREAYPGDVFYLHSRLLERAVKMNNDYLGGSLTALPIVETVQGDVSAYIPTNIISITDGQIYLDLNMHQEGVRPAVDPGLSVSRVGSSAQYKSMKALAGSLKLELAQYREVAQFSKFGSELDAATRKVLAKGKLLIEILKQPRNLPIPVYKQVMLLYAASSGFLDVLLLNNISLDVYQKSLFLFLERSHIVSPFRRSINLFVEKGLFKFFLNYHFDAWFKDAASSFRRENEECLFELFRLSVSTDVAYTRLLKRSWALGIFERFLMQKTGKDLFSLNISKEVLGEYLNSRLSFILKSKKSKRKVVLNKNVFKKLSKQFLRSFVQVLTKEQVSLLKPLKGTLPFMPKELSTLTISNVKNILAL